MPIHALGLAGLVIQGLALQPTDFPEEPKYPRRPNEATRRVGTAHPCGHATRPASALQPDRTRDPADTRVRAARQLGTSPPAHELRAARSRRAARTRRPRALARVHGRATAFASRLRIPPRSPSVRERLNAAYLAAINSS